MKTTCPDLAADLEVSNQSVSRRLRDLEAAALVERETVSDGQWVAIIEEGEQSLRSEYGDYRRVFDGEADVELRGTLTNGSGEDGATFRYWDTRGSSAIGSDTSRLPGR